MRCGGLPSHSVAGVGPGSQAGVRQVSRTSKLGFANPRSSRVVTQAALGDFAARLNTDSVAQALAQLQDNTFWDSQQPHFGTRAVTDLLQKVQPFITEHRPTVPSLPGADLFVHTEEQVVSLARGEADTVAAAADALSNSVAQAITSEAAVLAGDLGSLQPHFGSRAILRALEGLTHWFTDQLSGAAGAHPGAFQPVSAALDELRRSVLLFEGQAAGSPSIAKPSQLLVGITSALQQAVAGRTSGFSMDSLAAAAQDLLALAQAPGPDGFSLATLALMGAGVMVAVTATGPKASYDPMDSVLPTLALPAQYSPEGVAAYYARRPAAVARRGLQVATAALRFASGLLADIALGNLAQNAPKRAVQLRLAIERLGPAYVKVAQAVSTRVDILDINYLLEIERLQDRVPQFPTTEALQIMADAYGQPVEAVFSYLSPEPIAAASLGQVYRATLTGTYGGGEVAVKVQRPGVQESVALDLHLMRALALFLRRFPKTFTQDWVGLIDEWAVRFFHELDYEREAISAITFAQQMENLEGILVPDVYLDLTSRSVLTTAWVQGEKLSESNASDVRELCNTLLNCYLIQLLETGFLHADPHPGNLIRTPEGKICILDFGLMTEVSSEQSIGLVEYIAHLSMADWEAVTLDLQKLGFMPPGSPDPIAAGLVAPLGAILSQLVGGGGARNINLDVVTAQLDEVSRNYPFQVPAYFALILRCFSVIEGIALRVDPDYAIVKECFPYLSRRLLTDNHPRMRAALRQLLYGDKTRLDIARLQSLAAGFGSFTVNGIQDPSQLVAQAPVLDSTAREALKVVFSRDGSYVQELLVDELVAAVDALGRETLSEVCRRLLGSVPAVAAMSAVHALGPARFVLLPVPTPVELLNRLAPAVAPTEEDEEALTTIRGILDLLARLPPPEPASGQRALAAWSELYPMLPELLPGVARTGEMFVKALIRRIAMRIAEDVQPSSAARTATGVSTPTSYSPRRVPYASPSRAVDPGMF
ncbi:hypothetical protein WJX72_006718 [[Myrmecia] bisecta]|uniref:Protein kinase domain-containing protein n=1 Tax=[Myrmecia] bisecta TaxID=41462 RepID=A0AAW1QR34_9CHLO